jgi:hypothetical protein
VPCPETRPAGFPDRWTDDGNSILEYVAGIADLIVARAAACRRWPGAKISLRQGARVSSELEVCPAMKRRKRSWRGSRRTILSGGNTGGTPVQQTIYQKAETSQAAKLALLSTGGKKKPRRSGAKSREDSTDGTRCNNSSTMTVLRPSRAWPSNSARRGVPQPVGAPADQIGE